LLAGIGVAIALEKELDHGWVRHILAAAIILFAAVGGMFTGAIAAGCYTPSDSAEEPKRA
jgi:hypothetical protein